MKKSLCNNCCNKFSTSYRIDFIDNPIKEEEKCLVDFSMLKKAPSPTSVSHEIFVLKCSHYNKSIIPRRLPIEEVQAVESTNKSDNDAMIEVEKVYETRWDCVRSGVYPRILKNLNINKQIIN